MIGRIKLLNRPIQFVFFYDWVTAKYATMPLPYLTDDGVIVIDDSESQVSQIPLYIEPGGS